jgi:hypothetical protein
MIMKKKSDLELINDTFLLQHKKSEMMYFVSSLYRCACNKSFVTRIDCSCHGTQAGL